MNSFRSGIAGGVLFIATLFLSPLILPSMSSVGVRDWVDNFRMPAISSSDKATSSFKPSPQEDGFGPIYESAEVTQWLHGQSYGHEAIDISSGAGSTIYSPISGDVNCSIDGLQNTVLTITNSRYQVILMHGNYSTCVGSVKRGDPVGTEASIGNSTGPHTHINVCRWVGGVCNNVNPFTLGLTGRIYAETAVSKRPNSPEYALMRSWYDTSLGGTNCDSDCSTMASGDKVIDWIGGRNGVYAAACPREWGWSIGTRFTMNGFEFECRDTGGYIQCYEEGEVDIALSQRDTYGQILIPYFAPNDYCWVDTLGDFGWAYGSQTTDWSFR